MIGFLVIRQLMSGGIRCHFLSELRFAMMDSVPPAQVLGMLIAAVSHLTTVVDSLVPRVEAVEDALSGSGSRSKSRGSKPPPSTRPPRTPRPPRAPRPFEIYVRTPTGQTLELSVLRTDHIEDVKSQLERITGIPRDHQSLMFARHQLNDGNTLQDYSIMRQNVLNLVIIPAA
jgi:hypothetical protein